MAYTNHVVHQQSLAGKGGQPAYTLKNKFSKRFHSDAIEEPFLCRDGSIPLFQNRYQKFWVSADTDIVPIQHRFF